MPALQHIYLAERDAYRLILDEARASPYVETGGILVGRMFYLAGGPVLAVVAASGPGPLAYRGPDVFEPDTAALQAVLNHWRGVYFDYRADYIGQWHTHVSRHPTPSAADTAQVIAILNDPAYQLPDGMFTPIVTVSDGQVALFAYYYPRETPAPQLVPWTVVEGDGLGLLQTLADAEV